MSAFTSIHDIYPLSKDQLESFLNNGYLVVDNVLSIEEIEHTRNGLHETLLKHNIDAENLKETAINLKKLSSTGGAGGVLDIFYPEWKLKIAENPKFFSILSQLWDISYFNNDNGNDNNEDGEVNNYFPNPFCRNNNNIQMNCTRGYCYIDRIGFRIPSEISNSFGKSKKKGIQRSLTPHLDCCPEKMINLEKENPRWRPLQSFISLTDNFEANTGGFECVPGFHKEFHVWSQNRPRTILKDGTTKPAPCVGEYTHIRPIEDCDILNRIKHIPCSAGSAVIWDWRLPHSNARENKSTVTREVVYASFLPDVPINKEYAKVQLERYQNGLVPQDQWINQNEPENEPVYHFNELGRRLMNIDNW